MQRRLTSAFSINCLTSRKSRTVDGYRRLDIGFSTTIPRYLHCILVLSIQSTESYTSRHNAASRRTHNTYAQTLPPRRGRQIHFSHYVLP